MTDLEQFFRQAASLTESTLEQLTSAVTAADARMADSMRWSLFAGGKRLRPSLVLAAGRAFGAADERLLHTAAAIEMLHTYSLIHDDLPAMDDDDLRRGRATSHIKFGEATAILAGDALQALAFQTIAEDESLTAEVRVSLISGLGVAAAKMVAGQQLDLDAEGKEIGLAELENIHANKTGALIAFSIRAGAIIASALPSDLDAVSKYGDRIGLLFQVVDDILDVTQPTETLGKTAGKDIDAKKSTYPAVVGIDESRRIATRICDEALGLLPASVKDDPILTGIPEFLAKRDF